MARKKKALDRLTQRAMEARRLGMSYGKYIAKFYPQNPSDGEDLMEELGIYDKPVVSMDQKTGKEKWYASARATEADGYTPHYVVRCLRGRNQSHRQHYWRLASPEDRRRIEKNGG